MESASRLYEHPVLTLSNDFFIISLQAAQRGHLDVVKALISNGAKVNIGMKDWTTPLHLAAMGWSSIIDN